ncbi:hypothetical protein MBLNU457_g0402t1 [Dothideomycetes sp. NU457]
MAGTSSPLSRDDPSSTSSTTLCNTSPNTSYDSPYTTSSETDGLVLSTSSHPTAASKSSSVSSTSTAYASVPPSASSSSDKDIAKGWHLTLTLLFLTLLTGMQDVATMELFDGFASNYTGDLMRSSINLARSVMQICTLGWISNVKFATFMLTSVVVGQSAHWAGARSKRWVCFSSLMQAACLTAGAVVSLIFSGSELLADGRPLQLSVVALMCVGGTAQIVMTRTLDREITSALFTGPTLDVCSDPKFFAFCRHPTRYPTIRKRTLMIACAVTGAIIGTVLQEEVGAETVLVVASSLRILVVVSLALAPTEQPADESLPLANIKLGV